ncbi:unnamed protein product [Rangifer tarandus platyrhynchus]|uniref:Uncharacterized protein n=1 Tax=Rangifer tarandus platyrhynchus TaxID=3082113 RepID=A0AC59ZNH7_RANTA
MPPLCRGAPGHASSLQPPLLTLVRTPGDIHQSPSTPTAFRHVEVETVLSPPSPISPLLTIIQQQSCWKPLSFRGPSSQDGYQGTDTVDQDLSLFHLLLHALLARHPPRAQSSCIWASVPRNMPGPDCRPCFPPSPDNHIQTGGTQVWLSLHALPRTRPRNVAPEQGQRSSSHLGCRTLRKGGPARSLVLLLQTALLKGKIGKQGVPGSETLSTQSSSCSRTENQPERHGERLKLSEKSRI